MSWNHRFTPFGAVSARPEFASAHPSPGELPSPGARALLELIGPDASPELDEDLFFLAWELVSMQPGLDDAELRAAAALVIATLVNLRRGSTCLPLSDEGLGQVVAQIAPREAGERWAPERLARDARALVARDRLGAILGQPGDYAPLIVEHDAIYHQRMLHYEEELVGALSERLATQTCGVFPPDLPDGARLDRLGGALADVRASSSVSLTGEQQSAILLAAWSPLALIVGGPGTGKTSVVVSLLRLLVRLGVPADSIALAAPTGKAANRMQESIASQLAALTAPAARDLDLAEQMPSPQTLHRLLGYSSRSGGFLHHEYNRLNARVVVVDESSMIDLFLMDRLLRALRPDTHLVFLGDADQLPSVEAGALLRDMTPARASMGGPWRALVDGELPEPGPGSGLLAAHAVRLTRSHRMSADDPDGARILGVARRLGRGEADGLVGEGGVEVRPTLDEVTWRGVELHALDLSSPDPNIVRARLKSFADAWISAALDPPGGFDGIAARPLTSWDGQAFDTDESAWIAQVFAAMARAKILCLTRVFATGTGAINEMFLARVRAAQSARSSEVFLPGVPVMMLRNDYERELFNGDQGVVFAVRRGRGITPMAVFARADGFEAFELGPGMRARLEPCFAMTVHKSQGSEYERVALVLPPEPIPLLTREVLYTALTRSKTGSLVLGAPDVLEHGASVHMIRFSRVVEKIDRLQGVT